MTYIGLQLLKRDFKSFWLGNIPNILFRVFLVFHFFWELFLIFENEMKSICWQLINSWLWTAYFHLLQCVYSSWSSWVQQLSLLILHLGTKKILLTSLSCLSSSLTTCDSSFSSRYKTNFLKCSELSLQCLLMCFHSWQ